MAVDLIRYDLLVQEALRSVLRNVLVGVARDGLPGEHHFYITFRTHAQGVRLSQRMRDLYPDEMTIVLQHQFWDLSITEEAFEVGLSFQRIPEMLRIPFDAVTGFADPAVGFELRFAVEEEAAEASASTGREARPQHEPASAQGSLPFEPPTPAEQSEPAGAATESEPAATEPKEAGPKVISIDAFRRKT